MRKWLLALVISSAAFTCKPKQKVAEPPAVNPDTSSVQEMPRPGVPNQKEFDSIKRELDEERRRRDSLKH